MLNIDDELSYRQLGILNTLNLMTYNMLFEEKWEVSTTESFDDELSYRQIGTLSTLNFLTYNILFEEKWEVSTTESFWWWIVL